MRMPGFLLHLGATVLCAHGGQATPTVSNPRVLLSGQPAATLGAPYMVAGCAMPPPPAGNGPCVSGQWLTGATRVLIGGQPALLQTSPSICAPTGTPMTVAGTQTRVTGT
jgi:uncharacterized Zn-binding protein involved in type VI secretion